MTNININDYKDLKVGDCFVNTCEIGNGGEELINIISPYSICEITKIYQVRDKPVGIRTIINFKSEEGVSGFFHLSSHNSKYCYISLREKNLKLLNI